MSLSGVCEEKFNEYVQTLDAKIAPSIELIKKLIAAIILIGQDPKNYQTKDGPVNLEQLLVEFNNKRNEAVKAAYHQFEEQCQPYQDVAKAQAIFNALEVLATGGLSLVLKDQLKIDLKEIIKDGKLLGGDNSVANQIRAAILGTVITGDLRKAIENPGKAASDAIKGVADEIGKLGEEIKKIIPTIELPNIPIPKIDLPPLPELPPIPLPQLPPLPELPPIPLPQLPPLPPLPPIPNPFGGLFAASTAPWQDVA